MADERAGEIKRRSPTSGARTPPSEAALALRREDERTRTRISEVVFLRLSVFLYKDYFAVKV